jgi:hypothetical protein
MNNQNAPESPWLKWLKPWGFLYEKYMIGLTGYRQAISW